MAGGRAGIAHLCGPRLLNPAVKLAGADLTAGLADEAKALGFDCIGVADPAAITDAGRHFRDFLAAGAHGNMDWLAAHPERRADPCVLWPDVRSIVHTHPPYCNALSMTGRNLEVAHMDAAMFWNDCAYLDEWPGVPVADDERFGESHKILESST